MSVISTLLQAMVRLDGEAVVIHVGERPYVVTPSGQVSLASRHLTLDAVKGLVGELFPLEVQKALDEVGAAHHELPPTAVIPGERFTAVAAKGGDDMWLEIRRRRAPQVAQVQPERAPEAAAGEPPHTAIAVSKPQEPAGVIPDISALEVVDDDDTLSEGAIDQTWEDIPLGDLSVAESTAAVLPPPDVPAPTLPRPAPAAPPPPVAAPPPPSSPTPPAPRAPVIAPPPPVRPAAVAPPPHVIAAPQMIAAPQVIVPPPAPVAADALPRPKIVPELLPRAAAFGPIDTGGLPQGVVVPLARQPIRADTPPPVSDPRVSLDVLLRLAAARGASSLYLSSGAAPAVRVDGEVETLDGAPVLDPNEVESLLLTLMPERGAEALRSGVASEWIYDVPDLGRLRCMSFRDHRGPGGVFRMLPTRPVSAEQLGLSRQIQTLAIEPEGLLLVAGPRSSGKRTLMSAFIDLINRARHDHVITIETEINVVHERSGSFISQREVRGSYDEMLATARAALREDPDVLVLEEVRTPELMNVALDAAASGQLVIAGIAAHSASGAIDRIIDLYPPEYRRQIQLWLAQNLRGVVAQVLLRKSGGGRVAAREVLLNTPAVRSVLAEGKTSQLPLAIEGGRVHGMTPMNDALVGYVQGGIVDVREAYRRAADGPALLAMLKRHGLDTSALERYA